MIFQWPAVGVGTFSMRTSMTTVRFYWTAFSSAGLNSAAEATLTPSMP
jgi:hypothetical protein